MTNRHLVFISDLGHTGPIWPQILDGVASQGWRVTILSPKLSFAQKKFFYLNYSPKKWRLIQTKSFTSPYRKYAGYPRIIRRIFQMSTVRKVQRNLVQNDYFDGYSEWKELALAELNNLFETDTFELVVSSSSPFISHVIAKEFIAIKKLRWIADYRDMWSLNHNSKVIDQNMIEMEREILSFASACSTTSRGFQNSLSQIYQGPIAMIQNGYDFLSPQKTFFGKSVIQILYPGQIYDDLQDIRPVLKALQTFNGKEKDFQFELLVSGYAIAGVRKVAEELGLLGVTWLKFGGILPLQKSLRLQRKADLLLLLNIIYPDIDGVMQTKLYEYIASGVPIVAVGGEATDESSLLISRSGTGIVLRNESEIVEFLNNMTRHNFRFPRRNEPLIQSLSRQQQGIRFSQFIESLE